MDTIELDKGRGTEIASTMTQCFRTRNVALLLLSAVALHGLTLGCEQASLDIPVVQVYKSPSCSCCTKWVQHLENAGFRVEVMNASNLDSIKSRMGVPIDLRSCHTATIEGYVVEGHVPAEDLKLLLSSRPEIRGIAVPEMPIGSPGMESADRSRYEDFEVISFGDSGTQVFASHRAPE